VKEYADPFERVLLLKASPTTVCGALSWFTQVTVEPRVMVRVPGTNAKF